MRIVAISDTHGRHEALTLPPGDVLVHAGDALKRGRLSELEALDRWLGGLPYRHKVLIAGNHDWCFEQEPNEARRVIRHATYLQDEACRIEGLLFYGSPWQPRFFDWAFNLDRGKPLRDKWRLIPAGVDVLITHGPPQGILDRASRGVNVGCEELLERVQLLAPRVHIFGHIHEGAGRRHDGATEFVNASSLDERYEPANEPMVIDIDPA